MAKEINSIPIVLLRDEIQKRFGKKVVYASDCDSLSEDILLQTKRRISVSTLKLFFGVVHSPYAPSKYTIDSLLANLQFENESDFIKYLEGKK